MSGKKTVDGLRKSPSFLAFLLMARHPTKPWLKLRYLRCGSWLNNLSVARGGLSPSAFPSLRREPMAVMQGQALARRAITYRLADYRGMVGLMLSLLSMTRRRLGPACWHASPDILVLSRKTSSFFQVLRIIG